MKESKWLHTYVEEVTAKRNKSMASKKILRILMPVMSLLMCLPMLTSGEEFKLNGDDPTKPLLMIFGIVLACFFFLVFSAGLRKDVAKYTRENVEKLLRSDEEVECFDEQMMHEPLEKLDIALETFIFLTDDYVGTRFLDGGDVQYTFIRRNEIGYYDYAKTSGTSGNALKAAYFFDILNHEKKKIMGGHVDSGKQLAQLEEFLKLAQPTVQKK